MLIVLASKQKQKTIPGCHCRCHCCCYCCQPVVSIPQAVWAQSLWANRSYHPTPTRKLCQAPVYLDVKLNAHILYTTSTVLRNSVTVGQTGAREWECPNWLQEQCPGGDLGPCPILLPLLEWCWRHSAFGLSMMICQKFVNMICYKILVQISANL